MILKYFKTLDLEFSFLFYNFALNLALFRSFRNLSNVK